MFNKHCTVWLTALFILLRTGEAHAADMGTIYVGADLSDVNDINIVTYVETYTSFLAHAFGIYVNGGTETTETKAGNNLTITTYGAAADGIRTNPSGLLNWANAKGNIRVGNDMTINTYGLSADGINLNGYNKLYIGNDAAIATHYTGTLVHTDGMRAEGAHAVRANFNSEIYIGDDLRASTEGDSSHALYSAQGSGIPNATNGAKIFIGDGLRASTSGNASYGAYVASRNGIIAISDDSQLSTIGSNSHAAYVDASSLSNESKISFGKNAKLDTTGDDSDAAYAASAKSKISFGDGASLSTLGERAHGAHTGNNTASIEFLGDTDIATSDTTSYAIYAERGTIASSIEGGRFFVSGDIAAVSGSVDLTMTAGSVFTGKTSVGNGEISLNTASTIWNVTGDSTLTNLILNNSVVNYLDTPTGTTITVENLGASASDTGLFRMNTDIVNEFADMLIVTGTAQGSYLIDIQNDGGLGTTGLELTDLVSVNAGQNVLFTLDHDVELGGWLYELAPPEIDSQTRSLLESRAIHVDNTWFLRATGKASAPAIAAVNTFTGAYLMSYAETETLLQRLGDLRTSPRASGLWFRAHGGKFESNAKSFVSEFDMDYGGIHIGYDRKYDIGGNGDFYGGIMFGYGKGELKYLHSGKGDVDSKMLGIYGTLIQPSGLYIDAVLKYQWMGNDFDVLDSASDRVIGGGVNTGGLGASIEFGQRIPFSGVQKSGWYAEPQVQLSYMRQDGGIFTASNNLRIGVEPFTSLLGRLGILIGYETPDKNFYAKVSRVKEFDGDLLILSNGTPVSEGFGGSWWVYGLGFTSKVNDRNSVYVDVERASGGTFTQPWSAKIGWRTEI